MMNGSMLRQCLALTLLVSALLTTPTHAQQQTAADSVAHSTTRSDAEQQKQPGAELFVRTELFFGAERPDGTEISKDEFRRFLKVEVTPRFPDGLTLLTGTGQFRDAERNRIIREKSMLLILLCPLRAWKESDEKIEQIRKAYKERFKQQSVLRVDDPRPVLVSF